MVKFVYLRYRQIDHIPTMIRFIGGMNNQNRMPRERRELDPEDVNDDFVFSFSQFMQIDDIKYLFDYEDQNKDGFINEDELKMILVEAEMEVDDSLFYELIKEINPDYKELYDVDMVIHFFQICPEVRE